MSPRPPEDDKAPQITTKAAREAVSAYPTRLDPACENDREKLPIG